MSRKIEKLLRIVSEMQILEKENNIEQNQVIQFMPDELTDSDLDMVAAASQAPNVSEFLKKDKS